MDALEFIKVKERMCTTYNVNTVTIVHWILVVGVYGVIIGTIGWAMLVLTKKYIRLFKEKQADEISVFVGLITLAMAIFASDLIKSILSINLVSLMILVFVGYTVVRGVIQTENIEAKQKVMKGIAITVGCIGVVAVIGHFFGIIGIIAIPIGGMLAYMDR